MRKFLTLSGVALTLSLIGFAVGEEITPAKKVEKPRDITPEKSSAEEPPVKKKEVSKYPEDERAILKSGVAFAAAYCTGNAKGVAELYTTDAEYVDEQGQVYAGRQKIEDLLNTLFVDKPTCKLELDIESIRFVSPGVAIEDGTSTIYDSQGLPHHSTRYTAVHVKVAGKWLTASARDNASTPVSVNHVDQLNWLLGDWVDEDDHSVVEFSCQPILDGKFLARDFTVKIAGKAAVSGSQRIGRDPLTGQLKVWTFDSEGGHGEGTWHRNGEEGWILKTTGVSSDGSIVSGTSIYSFVNAHTITWQAVNHDVDGVRLADGEVYTLVRMPPKPLVNEKPVVLE